MKHNKNRRTHVSLLMAVVLPLSAATPSRAGDDYVVVTEGATIKGTINGTLRLLKDGEVQILPGAKVTGDLVVPAQKSVGPAKGVASGGMDKSDLVQSSGTKVTNAESGKTLTGTVKAAEGYDLPPVFAPANPKAGRELVVDGASSQPADLRDVTTVSLAGRRALLTLPPGAYTDIDVSHGTLILGFGGGGGPQRYDFNQLEVGSEGRILIAGPVVVTLGGDVRLNGKIGDSAHPLWLDIRVSGGSVIVGPAAELNGFVTAPKGNVTVQSQAIIRGGVMAAKLAIDEGASVVSVSPDWAAEKGGEMSPSFPHRALRVQGKMRGLNGGLAAGLSAALSYINDEPFVMVASRVNWAEDKEADIKEQVAFLDAFDAMLTDTGFGRAGIVLADSSGEPPGQVRNLVLTADQFTAIVAELGQKRAVADNVRSIRESPEMLRQFRLKALELGIKH